MSNDDEELCFMPGDAPSSPTASEGGGDQQHDALLRALQLQREAYLHLSQQQFE
jgi:hypothetical protein